MNIMALPKNVDALWVAALIITGLKTGAPQFLGEKSYQVVANPQALAEHLTNFNQTHPSEYFLIDISHPEKQKAILDYANLGKVATPAAAAHGFDITPYLPWIAVAIAVVVALLILRALRIRAARTSGYSDGYTAASASARGYTDEAGYSDEAGYAASSSPAGYADDGYAVRTGLPRWVKIAVGVALAVAALWLLAHLPGLISHG